MMHDDKLRVLSSETALELPEYYAQTGRVKLSEQFHLQPVVDRVLERLIPTWGSDFACGTSKLAQTFKELGWIGTGGVDISFQRRGQPPTVIELKCADDLSACAWDAVKLAPAVLSGHVHAGYLLAGAPTQMWNKPMPGADLFATDAWETMGSRIRDKHIDRWRSWQEETRSKKGDTVKKRPNRHIPGLIAETFETLALGSFLFKINATPWELRLARVNARGAKATVWKCVPPR